MFYVSVMVFGFAVLFVYVYCVRPKNDYIDAVDDELLRVRETMSQRRQRRRRESSGHKEEESQQFSNASSRNMFSNASQSFRNTSVKHFSIWSSKRNNITSQSSKNISNHNNDNNHQNNNNNNNTNKEDDDMNDENKSDDDRNKTNNDVSSGDGDGAGIFSSRSSSRALIEKNHEGRQELAKEFFYSRYLQPEEGEDDEETGVGGQRRRKEQRSSSTRSSIRSLSNVLQASRDKFHDNIRMSTTTPTTTTTTTSSIRSSNRSSRSSSSTIIRSFRSASSCARTFARKECCICLHRYDSGDTICWAKTDQCDHLFHEDCMLEWMTDHDDCPICQTLIILLPQQL